MAEAVQSASPAVQAGHCVHYERRRPEETVLYQLVQEHAETFFAQVEAETGVGLPEFVKAEFEAFLECGVLAQGFLRVRCAECAPEKLVAFSCKKRGFCPSCGSRRMAETAAHRVDHVIPPVPVRHWVVSFPIPLRFLLAAHPQLLSPVLGVVNRAISTFLIKPAGLNRVAAQTGALTLIQRFGSAANLNIPLHCLYLDGVYDITEDVPVFHPVRSPSAEQVQTLLNKIIQRIMRLLIRTGHSVEEHETLFMAENTAETNTALAPLQAAACTYRIALGPRAGRKVVTLQTVPSSAAPNTPNTAQRCAQEQGFSLHADVCCALNQRNKLEQLCRYITRPAIAHERLSINHNGDVVLQLKTPYKDGTTPVVMSPLEFMQRLAALVPRPRLNLIRFHGVLAPNAKIRSLITPGRPVLDKDAAVAPHRASHHWTAGRMSWARLLKRAFDIDIEHCPHCGGTLKIIAAIEDPAVITKILAHLGLPPRAPPRIPARPLELFETP